MVNETLQTHANLCAYSWSGLGSLVILGEDGWAAVWKGLLCEPVVIVVVKILERNLMLVVGAGSIDWAATGTLSINKGLEGTVMQVTGGNGKVVWA
jgi:hypothetical protein